MLFFLNVYLASLLLTIYLPCLIKFVTALASRHAQPEDKYPEDWGSAQQKYIRAVRTHISCVESHGVPPPSMPTPQSRIDDIVSHSDPLRENRPDYKHEQHCHECTGYSPEVRHRTRYHNFTLPYREFDTVPDFSSPLIFRAVGVLNLIIVVIVFESSASKVHSLIAGDDPRNWPPKFGLATYFRCRLRYLLWMAAPAPPIPS